jgi:hypothetical protein
MKTWTKAKAEKRLLELGFEIDWSCVDRSEGYWSGTMDATNHGMIDGDCRGEVVHGDNAADFYKNCVEAAEGYAKAGPNAKCTDPNCQFHNWIEPS